MPFVERGARRIHYALEGAGPGIALVPGLGSGAKLFGTLPRRFARAGFTCAAIDPVGLEPSSPLPDGTYDFTDAALDVLAVAAQLPRPVTLVGTSLGGKVSLRAAALAGRDAPAAPPVDRLVLLCSAAAVTARARRVYRMFERISTEVDGSLLGDLLAPFLFGATFLAARPGVVDDIVRAMQPTAASRACMAAQARALQTFDGTADAAHCQVPTLCLAGGEDTLTPASEVAATAALLPQGCYQSLPAAGHSLLLESADAFAAVSAFASGA